MDSISGIVRFIVEEILSQPALLLGIIVLVGLVALRKPAGDIIGGTLKGILGFVILGVGAGAVVAALEPLGTMVLEVFGAQGVVPTNEAITAIAAGEFGVTVAWVMLVGFLVNLALARFTPLKYIFLTGHHMLFMATMLAVVLSAADIVNVPNVLLGGVLMGTVMVVMPALGPAIHAAHHRRPAGGHRALRHHGLRPGGSRRQGFRSRLEEHRGDGLPQDLQLPARSHGGHRGRHAGDLRDLHGLVCPGRDG